MACIANLGSNSSETRCASWRFFGKISIGRLDCCLVRTAIASSDITIVSRSDRNDYKDFSLLSPQAANLMRRLASKIKAVTLVHDNIFAIELDDDSSADHKQHFLAGVRSS